ncbi:cellulose-binding domain-containing protein, partial [Micromonospora sp. KC723]|uniref:cellulose-binding domain-containing protein n=1 Tax=Micromonospora sp. KC723 TaxID=2530381 RepID=UPI001FB66979
MRLIPSRRAALFAAITATTLVAGTLTAVTAAAAATGCRVDYRITNQWGGGFGADITITNLGDPVNGWTLTWSYTAGQQVAQAWNATVSQSGAQVTARDAGHNARIDTNGTANFGFNGSWNDRSNPVPDSFALNGTTCTGTANPTTSPPPST